LLPGDIRTLANRNNFVIRELHLPDPPPRVEDRRAVSVARLKHKVPKKAQEAFRRASEMAQRDKHEEAVSELERAVAIDPEFADGFNNLGVQHFLLRHSVEAEASIRRALELDPSFVTAHINFAHLALRYGDIGLAEKEAQRAVALGDEDGEAQMILNLVRSATRATQRN
jgi:Flp pilus assembly protein TadD